MPPLVDRAGRTVRKLRLSITDRCDLRCVYCMPAEGLPWKKRDELLTFEELTRLSRLFVDWGARELRITGGEPLVRSGLPELVAMLGGIDGVRKLSLTTNGVLLDRLAAPLAAAGITHVNISLDTLDRAAFVELTRRDAFDRVIAGIDAACEHFPGKVKLNAVALRGRTEDEAVGFAELARRRGIVVRFIEFMPLDADREWSRDTVLDGAELRRRIEAAYPLVSANADDVHSPAREYHFADGTPGGIGFIDSVSAPFCDHCDRVRLTADGKLRTCLFATAETDLLGPMRAGATDAALEQIVRDAVWIKEPGHKIDRPDFVPASRSMSEIGG